MVAYTCENPPVVSPSKQPKYKSADELCLAFAGRGFRDAQTESARQLFERVSYQHLIPYINAIEGSLSFKRVHDLLTLDRSFQSSVFKYIGIFETQLRAVYADAMARAHGAFAIYNPDLFYRRDIYESSMEIHETELQRKARHDRSVKRSLKRYGGKLPIWHAVEVMTLGTLSKLYSNTKDRTVASTAPASFGVTKPQLSSWLITIAEARNAFAHFDPYIVRKQIPAVPLPIRELSTPNTSPLYIVILLYRLLDSPTVEADPNTHYSERLRSDIVSILDSYFDAHGNDGRALNIPDDWRAVLSFWDTLPM